MDEAKAIALVQEIASSNPTTVDTITGHTNLCRYCEVGWPETLKDIQYRLANNGKIPLHFYQAPGRHNEDCIWLRAIQICGKVQTP